MRKNNNNNNRKRCREMVWKKDEAFSIYCGKDTKRIKFKMHENIKISSCIHKKCNSKQNKKNYSIVYVFVKDSSLCVPYDRAVCCVLFCILFVYFIFRCNVCLVVCYVYLLGNHCENRYSTLIIYNVSMCT